MTTALRCPYCFMELDGSEPEVTCSECRTPHHQACFLEHGRCVVLGCTGVTSRTSAGVLVRSKLEITLGPTRHPFLVRAGFRYGEPRWLEVSASLPEAHRVIVDKIEVGLAIPMFARGDKVTGEVSLHLTQRLRARGVRLLMKTLRITPRTVIPTTVLEREAVIVGYPWEGHLRTLGSAILHVLHRDDPDTLVTLDPGVTRWTFQFQLDALHPIRTPEDPASFLTDLVAYVDLPAHENIETRASLHVTRKDQDDRGSPGTTPEAW